MTMSSKSHKRNKDGTYKNPLVESTRTDCQKADDCRTEVSHQKSTDIHEIMKKTVATGVQQHVSMHEGTYENYLGVPEYQDAQNQIAAAKSMFESIPAEIRSEFNNDPATFVDWIQNDENREAIEKAGFSASHLKIVKDEKKASAREKQIAEAKIAAQAAQAAQAEKQKPGVEPTKEA